MIHILDIGITILFTTYAADMMALMVSSLVKTTTTAMTVMPFLLIFQLVFSGGFFELEGIADALKSDPAYLSTRANVGNCWTAILLLAALFVLIAGTALMFVDRDKR